MFIVVEDKYLEEKIAGIKTALTEAVCTIYPNMVNRVAPLR